MPSLRRSFSSPSVRSSPYSPAPSALRTRAPPIHPRRSSPTATAERRVLADIEWWRVYDGQCDLDTQDHPLDEGQPTSGDVPPGGTVTLSPGGVSLEPPATPLSLPSLSWHSLQSLPPDPLAIAPYSPPGSRHSRDSSVESTPEMSTAPLDSLGLPSSVACPFGDQIPFSLPIARAGGRQAHPLFGLRSVSAPGLSYQGSYGLDFQDIGGDSFSLDQNLFQ